ncbi:MAG: transcriptional regulator [Candidatus Omnitrophica bacterium]|nr:transcriptional regulator [Candidatus Omnitrophota bacterium]
MGAKSIKLINFFKTKRGLVSYAEIRKAGYNKTNLKDLLNFGQVQKIDRALYKLTNGPALSNPDFAAVSIKAPRSVVCLISALAFHEATSEIPGAVDLAIERGDHANKIAYPPVRFYRFAPEAWRAGIEKHNIEGHTVKVYNLAKTVTDCFKFRNKIGINIAREALKVAVTEKRVSPKEVMRYAKICRISNVIKPILESLI